jgi:hypothetical protein
MLPFFGNKLAGRGKGRGSILFVNSFVGDASVTLSGIMPGDLLLFTAYRLYLTAQPSTPSGFTLISGAASANTSYCFAKKISDGTETTVSSASPEICGVAVYRPVGGIIGVGAVGTAFSAGSASSASFPALALTNVDGSSWVFGGEANSSQSNYTDPAGFVSRGAWIDSGFTDQAQFSDTGGPVSAWTSHSAVFNTAAAYRSVVAEITIS